MGESTVLEEVLVIFLKLHLSTVVQEPNSSVLRTKDQWPGHHMTSKLLPGTHSKECFASLLSKHIHTCIL